MNITFFDTMQSNFTPTVSFLPSIEKWLIWTRDTATLGLKTYLERQAINVEVRKEEWKVLDAKIVVYKHECFYRRTNVVFRARLFISNEQIKN